MVTNRDEKLVLLVKTMLPELLVMGSDTPGYRTGLFKTLPLELAKAIAGHVHTDKTLAEDFSKEEIKLHRRRLARFINYNFTEDMLNNLQRATDSSFDVVFTSAAQAYMDFFEKLDSKLSSDLKSIYTNYLNNLSRDARLPDDIEQIVNYYNVLPEAVRHILLEMMLLDIHETLTSMMMTHPAKPIAITPELVFQAIDYGNAHLLKLIIEEGSLDLTKPLEGYEDLPLVHAIKRLQLPCIELLIEAGADLQETEYANESLLRLLDDASDVRIEEAAQIPTPLSHVVEPNANERKLMNLLNQLFNKQHRVSYSEDSVRDFINHVYDSNPQIITGDRDFIDYVMRFSVSFDVVFDVLNNLAQKDASSLLDNFSYDDEIKHARLDYLIKHVDEPKSRDLLLFLMRYGLPLNDDDYKHLTSNNDFSKDAGVHHVFMMRNDPHYFKQAINDALQESLSSTTGGLMRFFKTNPERLQARRLQENLEGARTVDHCLHVLIDFFVAMPEALKGGRLDNAVMSAIRHYGFDSCLTYLASLDSSRAEQAGFFKDNYLKVNAIEGLPDTNKNMLTKLHLLGFANVMLQREVTSEPAITKS